MIEWRLSGPGFIRVRGLGVANHWGPPAGWYDLPPTNARTVLVIRDGRVIGTSEKMWETQDEAMRVAIYPPTRFFDPKASLPETIQTVTLWRGQVGFSRISKPDQKVEPYVWRCFMLEVPPTPEILMGLYSFGFTREH